MIIKNLQFKKLIHWLIPLWVLLLFSPDWLNKSHIYDTHSIQF